MEDTRTAPEKRTGEKWMETLEGKVGRIIDHDGWRNNDGVCFNTTPITLEDFIERHHQCTTYMMIPEGGWDFNNSRSPEDELNELRAFILESSSA